MEAEPVPTLPAIRIRGARQHNLKNISLDLPRNRLIVITGVSGSGKSSLAFDTLYAEGQRRYIESLSAYARQFLGQMDKPDVDAIEGLSPAIAIEQRAGSRNPRSTVGTVTEIHDYLRLLFARIGIPHCPNDGHEIVPQSIDRMVEAIAAVARDGRVDILAPVVRGQKGEFRDLLERLRKDGYRRFVIDGVDARNPAAIRLEKNKKHTIEVVVDTVEPEEDATRLSEATTLARDLAEGLVIARGAKGTRTMFSSRRACPECGFSIEELTPRMFSFNNPFGACPTCLGIGATLRADPGLIIPDRSKPLGKAIAVWGLAPEREAIERFGRLFGYDPKRPVSELSEAGWTALFQGSDRSLGMGAHGAHHWWGGGWLREGLAKAVERRWKATKSEGAKEYYMGFMTFIPCQQCHGDRLKPESLAVRVLGKSIAEFSKLPIDGLIELFRHLELGERDEKIVGQVVKEIRARLGFLENVGLTYLTLDRGSATLSGGEAERIALATQIGSGLVGVLYILDEPSIGLHPRDHARLLATLKTLRDLGNTVLVVEHDEQTMRESDWLIDLGLGAGRLGGDLLFAGRPSEIADSARSITGAFLSGRRSIAVPAERRRPGDRWLVVRGPRENNLKGEDIRLPLGTLVALSGVSGSGKSTLMQEILYKAVRRHLGLGREMPGKHDHIEGIDQIDRVLLIDQAPIGRTPRSNPATYTGLMTPMRELFSGLPESKARGFGPGRFSFNVASGRCEACEGDGVIRYEMHFLPDVYVACEECRGQRFNAETLEVKFKGKTIADVLAMTVDEALEFFRNHRRIESRLQLLVDVGLGYIQLGQSATTLSGGEAQRIKIAFELAKTPTGRTLYLLDEPTTGLHFQDVERLLEVLYRLRAGGNTVVVIEHNLDVLKCADWLIDLGPEGGAAGGRVVAQGVPEQVARTRGSYTGGFLAPLLEPPAIRVPARRR
ncbi:MAG: excinuclease ABC subunit UvrA [Thermoplasmata archaeon]|nr:excinuclease ABC subunit UvrA [Thermoplasmata archaeon]MCI4359949.1 excinuclease ABC subunit UvrA [Thermoplasmata archaeon]